MNKRFASIGVTAGLVAGGMAGFAIGITRIAGADQQESQAAIPAAGAAVAAAATTDQGSTTTIAASTEADDDADQSEADPADVNEIDETGDVADARDVEGDENDHDGPRGPGGRGAELEAAATALGMTADELRTSLQSGQTVAALAQAKGIDPQSIITAIVAEWTAREQEEVASGDHTQAEVDARLAGLTDRVTAIVNGTFTPGTGHAEGDRGKPGDKQHGGRDDGGKPGDKQHGGGDDGGDDGGNDGDHAEGSDDDSTDGD